MEFKLFSSLPDDARKIRTEVFVCEQGFREEFDALDEIAVHIVAYKGAAAAGVCRIFRLNSSADCKDYVLGRLAVSKEFRGQKIGSEILNRAELAVKDLGGKTLRLHSQTRASGFYRANGYTAFGEEDEDEGCPHIWMIKSL